MLDADYNYDIVQPNIVASHVVFGNIRISCKTGEVTGLSEDISADAQEFWDKVKEYIIGK